MVGASVGQSPSMMRLKVEVAVDGSKRPPFSASLAVTVGSTQNVTANGLRPGPRNDPALVASGNRAGSHEGDSPEFDQAGHRQSLVVEIRKTGLASASYQCADLT